ncbi:hypothetical protein KSP39_PZI016688 [Platanthera zijinensis]|uniref:Uncharacterized protein n=1 Tax=Platanthera zijinensis TaxID=2320716 RepID=A0AAP0G135_9ASPA
MSRYSTLDIVELQSFTLTDFHYWKLHVQLEMKERDIFYIVLSEIATTREGVDEFQWSKDEHYYRDYLLSSLNPHLVMTYNDFKTAKEIWDHLNVYFQEKEGLLKTLLCERFFNSKFNTNSSITSQIVELEKLRLKLVDEQSEISDNLFMSLILYKLPLERITFKAKM